MNTTDQCHLRSPLADRRVLQEWFTTVLLYSEVSTLAGPYNDFATIAGAALDMVAQARGVPMSAADRGGILQGMLSFGPIQMFASLPSIQSPSKRQRVRHHQGAHQTTAVSIPTGSTRG